MRVLEVYWSRALSLVYVKWSLESKGTRKLVNSSQVTTISSNSVPVLEVNFLLSYLCISTQCRFFSHYVTDHVNGVDYWYHALSRVPLGPKGKVKTNAGLAQREREKEKELPYTRVPLTCPTLKLK
jgi:hypothetical protein